MSTTSFADELRARSDESIRALFELRPDLVTPVPSDFSALAARANSAPSLIRALENLNKVAIDLLTAMCILDEPFAKSDLVALTDKALTPEIEELLLRAMIYQDGNKFRLVGNIRNLIGDEPAGLGPRLPTNLKIDFALLKQAPDGAMAMLERLMWGPPRGQLGNLKKPGPAISWLLENHFLLAMDSQTVVLPRDVAMHLRGGKIHKELTLAAPKLQ
ncbi:MAG: hypothetical protein F2815_01100, partial [Actinobacteria bacterium]|nr:hypothetical protein [Actinomycetota bacterium]